MKTELTVFQEPIDFSKIKLDIKDYHKIESLVEKYYDYNDGCILHPHWKRLLQRKIDGGTFETMGWLGGGYPQKTDYRQPHPDIFDFKDYFVNLDTVDIQSALYQFYTMEEICAINDFYFSNITQHINIIEIGGGYGRLAFPFLALFGEMCHYISVDYAPTSLTFAPQIIRQAFPYLKVMDTLNLKDNFEDYNFISLPTWEINKIKSSFYDLGTNIHSFQEMEHKSVEFYAQELHRTVNESGLIYIINNPPEKDKGYTNHNYYNLENYFGEAIFSKKYPIGADWEKICGVPTLERAFYNKERTK